MGHFIRVCTVCQNKIDLQRKKHNMFLEIITCDPSVYTMDHPDFIVCWLMENSIGLKRVKNDTNLMIFNKMGTDHIHKAVEIHVCSLLLKIPHCHSGALSGITCDSFLLP